MIGHDGDQHNDSSRAQKPDMPTEGILKPVAWKCVSPLVACCTLSSLGSGVYPPDKVSNDSLFAILGYASPYFEENPWLDSRGQSPWNTKLSHA